MYDLFLSTVAQSGKSKTFQEMGPGQSFANLPESKHWALGIEMY